MGAPVILCGRTEAIGSGVIADLQPEYEVIHFVMSPDSGAVQIPAILRGDQSIPADSALGSKDYTRPPLCIILGGGFDDAGVVTMMQAAEGLKPLPWLRPDRNKPAPPLGPAYGRALVRRIKELIPQLETTGKLDTSEVHYF